MRTSSPKPRRSFIIPVVAALEIITDASAWDTFLESQNAHLLQTYAWGELKSQFGWRAERVALTDSNQIITAAQILYRRLAPALTVAYVPRGPVSIDAKQLAPFLEKLKQHTRARGAFLLKLEPDWQSNTVGENALHETKFQTTLETIQPPATIHIDLTGDLETILARMKSKWRYNIRLSEKKNVVVRAGDVSDFNTFYELMQLTGERDHFAIHGANYYRTAFELLKTRDHVQLFIAEFQQKTLAMIFVSAFAHEAIYLYGASSNEERNRMPNHALHWAAIQWAKARGCTQYDLWGIPETVDESSDDANLPTTLYQFKQGFGGSIVRYTGAWDYIFNSPKYQLYKLARRLRKNNLG